MHLPFTVEQFFDVFSRYNDAVWPAQVVLLALAIAASVLTAVRRAWASRTATAILALLWAWTGVAYHISFFVAINPVARVFGALCVLQTILLLVSGVIRNRLAFGAGRGAGRAVGWVLIAYGLVVYPILGIASGHSFMDSPTFGAPCPTTIFTFGLLWLARRPLPGHLLVIPLIWSAVGGSAAFILGVRQDLGLVVAGICGFVLLATAGGRRHGDARGRG